MAIDVLAFCLVFCCAGTSFSLIGGCDMMQKPIAIGLDIMQRGAESTVVSTVSAAKIAAPVLRTCWSVMAHRSIILPRKARFTNFEYSMVYCLVCDRVPS
jgi:hypothetical protein